MSYAKITSFAVKDTMADNNPLKVVRGKEFDDEFDALTTAMAAQDAVIGALVTTPAGGMLMFAGIAAPAGFLLCDGAARSRNTYTTLFQAIGTRFGVGDGSTTFNVPNLTNRFPYGGAVGQLGGSADSIVPSHSHTASASVSISDPGHAHQYAANPVNVYGGAEGGSRESNGGVTSSTSASGTGITASASVAIGATGTSATNGNLPPFVGLNFIIKI